MAAILIADSGSTKTDWCLIQSGKCRQRTKTGGMNPLLQTKEQVSKVLESELSIDEPYEAVGQVVFYGAGVKDAAAQEELRSVLSVHFKAAAIDIHSDLLAAARATCGYEKGVACILGTGSNSGYYNGKIIKHQNPSLGYIIGDEGGGAFLGKRVLQYYFYRTFDEELTGAFQQKYGDDLSSVLRKVYQEPFANRYLATFVQFLKEHRGHYMVENIIEDAFIDFHQRHILKYRESWNYPVHFCGAVAYEFKDVIESLHEQYGLETGNIVKAPMDGLCAYHLG
ncbi:MAG TPA: N-acetylglucosamine kinase [Edaphocola sp.]|nr:N-acetylglucosamine kinase [Edaphocola sp.]